jgi:hypothetical protein
MKVNFPNITIAKVKKKVYSLDLSGGGAEPAQLKISFIAEDGEADSYQLNTSTVIDVSIGNFYDFKGYIISCSERQSVSSGITCELTLVDTSVILDKLWVGLKGKHGNIPAPLLKNNNSIQTQDASSINFATFSNINIQANRTTNVNDLAVFQTIGNFPINNLILVGNAVDPCQNSNSETPKDPCDPCSSSEANSSTFDCNKSRALDILNVNYTFADLIEAAKAKVSFSDVFSSSISYRAEYTGTLREVLNNWCKDYGYSFYWDPNFSQVVFIDLKSGIDIADNHNFGQCRVEDKSISRSIENITKNVNIAYFGSNGEIKDYKCASASSDTSDTPRPVTLTPLSLEKLIDGNRPLLTLYGGLANFATCIAARRIDSTDNLRNGFVWNNILGYKSPSNVALGYHPLLGFKIEAICYAQTTIQQVSKGIDVDACRRLYNTAFNDTGSGIIFTGDGEAERLREAGAYFVIISRRSSDIKRFEEGVINNFCGRYWAAATNASDESLSAPDGNIRVVESVETKTDSNNKNNSKWTFILPDINIMHPLIKNGNIGIIKTSQPTVTTENTGIRETTTRVDVSGENYILLDRSPSWVISPQEDLREDTKYLGLISVGAEQLSSFELDTTFYEVLLVGSYEGSQGNVLQVSSSIESHPNEKGGSSFGIASSVTEKIEFTYSTVMGREQRRQQTISVFMPTSQYYKAKKTRSKSRFNSEANVRIIVPKYEIIIADSNTITSDPLDEFVSFNINPIDITDNDISKIIRTNKGCVVDSAAVITYGNNIMSNLSVYQTKPKKSISYNILGLPTTKYTPLDGLTSFSVRLDQSGTKTSLSFSDVLPIPISDNLKKSQINYLLKSQSKKSFINKIIK